MLNRYKNLTLFQQLLVPMVILGVFAVGAIISSAFILERSVAELGDMYVASSERLKILQGLERDLAVHRALTLRHQASEGADAMRTLADELGQSRSRIEAYLHLLAVDEQKNGHQEANGKVNTMMSAVAAYFTGANEAMQLSSDFEKEAAFELLARTEGEYLSVIQNTMQHLTRHAFEEISVTRESLTQASDRNVWITIGMAILGGIFLLGMAFFVTRRASRRIHGLLAWSKRIALGDMNNRLVPDSYDEVGQLTSAMRSMVEHIEQGREALERAKQNAEAVAEELQLYANAFDNSGESMLITDHHNRIINVNASFTAQTGYTLDEVQGKDPGMLSSGNTPRAVYDAMWQCIRTDGFWHGELWDRKKSGEIYPKWTSISAIRDAHGKTLFYVASFSDISERKANEARIDYLAHHDALTGLINRYNLENRLDQALLTANRENLGVAVLFIDMDRFKNINDTLGHHMGDLLLIEIARRLKECVRDSDIVARLGGDEFVVVLPGLTPDLEAVPVAEKILRILGDTYKIENNQLHTSPSIGVAIFPNDGNDGQTLMKNADTAMYHAKERGRNNVQYFTSSMNVAASERLELEGDLREALQTGKLALHYQPQVCAMDEHACGVEALARWHHPKRGHIPPLKFIAIAEESGLIEELGRWVLDEACRQMAQWKTEGIHGIRMAVNLSAKQLRSPDLVTSVAGILKKHGLDGRDLELEITESAAMENPNRAIRTLQALRNLGVQLAIDDFGTGYSSLAYLKRLPINVLKLDRAFVRDIETDENDAEISAATLALAHNLGLKVVAEGVETEEQRKFLVAHQCDYLQGYYYCKPLPASEALVFLQQYK